MIVVIDYQAGNLYNVGNALRFLGAEFTFTGDPQVVEKADRIILPGQGAARPAMESLIERGLVDVLKRIEVPFLGICLGLQLLFEASAEEQTTCLGIIPGTVQKFDRSQVKVPQIGWNQVRQIRRQFSRSLTLFDDIADDSFFYFLHSYYAPIRDAVTIGITEYATSFASVVKKNNFWGVQFHPERSGEVGLKVLENFLLVR